MADEQKPHREPRVPPKCPFCGRLTVDNAQHCPDDPRKPGKGKWAIRCLTVVCRCGGVYRDGAQYRPAEQQPGGRR